MRRFHGHLLRVLPLVSSFVLGGCSDNDADDATQHAPCSTSGALPEDPSGAAETGSPAGSTGSDLPGTSTTGPGASAGDTTTSGGDSTAGTRAESASDGADDTGGTSAGDTGGAGESTGGVDTTGESTSGDTTGESTSGDTTGESTGGDAGPSFMGEIWPIFSGECGCHKDTNGAGGLVLKKSNAFDNLVGEPSKQLPDMKLVEPGDPATSYLWHKLNDTQKSVGGKGKRMPTGGLLDKQSLALVKQWIEQGALP